MLSLPDGLRRVLTFVLALSLMSLIPPPRGIAQLAPLLFGTQPAAAAVDDLIARVSVSSSSAEGNGDSRLADVSADGQLVVFSSKASSLVSDDTNGVEDVFVHDRAAGTTVRVSVSSTGEQGNGASEAPAISG